MVLLELTVVVLLAFWSKAAATIQVTRLAVGRTHSCVIFDDTNSSMKCWGNGADKQLGTGIPSHVWQPSLTGFVNVGGGVVDVAPGASHTCILLSSGSVKCFGLGSSGQLGYNNTAVVSIPYTAAVVGVGANVTQIAAGFGFTCALLQNSTVKCWGDDNYGQMGIGCTWSTCNCVSPTFGTNLLSPALIPPINVGGLVRRLEAGFAHVCAIFHNGSAVCWGYNNKGQLGLGSANCPPFAWDGIPASLGVISTGGNVDPTGGRGGAHVRIVREFVC
jgi:alpha-tubulin suppressor-like RCC1 family protein